MFPFTLQQLLILKALATEKNFTKAADSLYLSQPSLSKQIKTLEKNLNLLIINRETHKISLTDNGKVVLDYSEKILVLCEECCRVLIDLQTRERGNLTIGTNKTVGNYLLPKIIELFSKNYPHIHLKVTINSTPIIIKRVKNREVDIGLINGEISKEFKKNVLKKTFLEDEIYLIVPKFHYLTSKTIISKEDLYHLNFVTLNSSAKFRKLVDNSLIQNKIEINHLKIIMQLYSIEAIKVAVSLGLGAAFISSSMVEKEIKRKTITVLKIQHITIRRSFIMVNNPQSLKAQAFRVFYMELLKLKNNLES